MGRTRLGLSCTAFALALTLACGGNQATTPRHGEGLNDDDARVATNDGPGGGEHMAGSESGRVGTSGSAGDRPTRSTGATDTRTFLARMLADGEAEVELGRIAAIRAADAQVKDLARRIELDHARANEELRAIAERLDVRPAATTDGAHRAVQDRLSQLNGAAFDREYVNAMVTAHQNALDELKSMSGGDMPSHHDQPSDGATPGPRLDQADRSRDQSADRRNDPNDLQAVHAWAVKVAPVLQAHLDRARQLQGRGAERR